MSEGGDSGGSIERKAGRKLASIGVGDYMRYRSSQSGRSMEKYVATEEDTELVARMAASLLPEKAIADTLGIPLSVLRQHYEHVLNYTKMNELEPLVREVKGIALGSDKDADRLKALTWLIERIESGLSDKATGAKGASQSVEVNVNIGDAMADIAASAKRRQREAIERAEGAMVVDAEVVGDDG